MNEDNLEAPPTTLDPNQLVFDDEDEESNNVGGEEVEPEEPTTTLGPLLETATNPVTFFQGNGIRRPRPDTKTFLNKIGIPSRRSQKEIKQVPRANITPAPYKYHHHQSQRARFISKSLAGWNRSNKKVNESSQVTSGSNLSVSIIANTGPTRIALGPRLKFTRSQSHNYRGAGSN